MKKKGISYWMICIFLILALVITLLPIYLMLATSTKSTFQFATNFWGVAIPPKWDNYKIAWDAIGKYMANTIWVAILQVIGTLVISVLAGYAFAKMKFKGRTALFMLIMAFRMIPGTLTLIPNFLNTYKLGLYNTHMGVVLPVLAGLSFMPLLMTKSFFEGIPDDIFEAFRIDGANEFNIITKLVLPLSKPIVATSALFTFFGTFGQYVWPLLILADDKKKMIATGLMSFSGAYGTDYGVQMAAYSIVSVLLMVIVSLTMKTYVEGITAGAVKG